MESTLLSTTDPLDQSTKPTTPTDPVIDGFEDAALTKYEESLERLEKLSESRTELMARLDKAKDSTIRNSLRTRVMKLDDEIIKEEATSATLKQDLKKDSKAAKLDSKVFRAKRFAEKRDRVVTAEKALTEKITAWPKRVIKMAGSKVKSVAAEWALLDKDLEKLRSILDEGFDGEVVSSFLAKHDPVTYEKVRPYEDILGRIVKALADAVTALPQEQK